MDHENGSNQLNQLNPGLLKVRTPQQAGACLGGGLSGSGPVPPVPIACDRRTIREKLQERLSYHKREVDRLEDLLSKLSKSGIADIPANELQELMRF